MSAKFPSGGGEGKGMTIWPTVYLFIVPISEQGLPFCFKIIRITFQLLLSLPPLLSADGKFPRGGTMLHNMRPNPLRFGFDPWPEPDPLRMVGFGAFEDPSPEPDPIYRRGRSILNGYPGWPGASWGNGNTWPRPPWGSSSVLFNGHGGWSDPQWRNSGSLSVVFNGHAGW